MGGIPLNSRSLAFRWPLSQTHLRLFGGFVGTYAVSVYHSLFNRCIIRPTAIGDQREARGIMADDEKKDATPEYPTMEQLARAILREPPAEWEYMKRGKAKKKEKPA